MGVISSREIEEAEEYDVIGEVEQRAEELEKETPTAGESFSKAMKKVGGGFKSFFTHCGYFATNVRREIKRSRARKKRKKAEEERRRQHAERRQQSRERRRTDGGLVQVRSRGERRPLRPVGSSRTRDMLAEIVEHLVLHADVRDLEPVQPFAALLLRQDAVVIE